MSARICVSGFGPRLLWGDGSPRLKAVVMAASRAVNVTATAIVRNFIDRDRTLYTCRLTDAIRSFATAEVLVLLRWKFFEVPVQVS